MDAMWIAENGEQRPASVDDLEKAKGFLWIDSTAEDLIANPEAWRADIQRQTGMHIHDLHLQDASNPAHPSYFDNTEDYEMVVFRRIITSDARVGLAVGSGPLLLTSLTTQPMAFFIARKALVTVRHGGSITCDDMKRRLAALGSPTGNNGPAIDDPGLRLGHGVGLAGRLPAGPAELMLRLLNGMVDKYLALREPITQQLDRWQRELLNPKGRFRNWLALLDARIVLRRLENLCEEQYDALSELRDTALDRSEDAWGSGAFGVRRDALVVRINDVMEHVNRVLGHARRMESSVETAVQLHFSATAHRTNEVMRILTVVTVIFMPLTLITGIFGMNIDDLPFVHDRGAFWGVIVGMAALALVLWIWFSARRFLEMRPYMVAQALARKAGLKSHHATESEFPDSP